MRRVLLLLLPIVLLGCEQHVVAPPRPKTLIAERVEGTSPFQVMLGLAPEEPRAFQETRFTFAVSENGRAVRGANVHVSLIMPLMDMGKNEFTAQEGSPGLYQGTAKFNMEDEWEIIVTVSQGGKKGKHIFNIRVKE